MTSFNILFYVPVHALAPNDGLIVLLADLIKGLDRKAVRIRILVPQRLEAALAGVLGKNGLGKESYTLIPISCTPVLLRLYFWWISLRQSRRRKRPGSPYEALRDLFLAPARFVAQVGARAGLALIVLGGLLALPLLLLLLPFAFLAALAAIALRLLRRGGAGGGMPANLKRPLVGLGREAVEELFRVEAQRMAAAINARRDVHALFCPFSFCGDMLSRIKVPKLTVFPDSVTLEYPTRFLGQHSRLLLRQMQLSVRHSDALVCYSKTIAEGQLRKHFGAELDAKPVHVIPQGFFEVSAETLASNFHSIRFENFFPESCAFLPAYPIEDLSYIVYPSVDRPHKNMVTLIRAVEHLVRREQCDLKLITTSHTVGPDVRRLLEEKRFFCDCLFAPSLSEPDLNYLIKNAALVVHPSLAEGGDVFNFSRAVSVGVPALMADIPVVREMFERYGIRPDVYGQWLFEPRDYLSLAQLIQKSLQNRAQLAAEQAAVLKTLQKYNYAAMAAHYQSAYASLRASDPPH